MKTIRGMRVIHERRKTPPPDESLRYTIDVYDERDNYVECLGRLADLFLAQVAFQAAAAKWPEKRLFLRDRARVIRRYDAPRG